MPNKITVSSPRISTYSVSENTLQEVWASMLKKGRKIPMTARGSWR